MTDMVRMTYNGPGVKPPDIEVSAAEAEELAKSDFWSKSKKKKTLSEEREAAEEKQSALDEKAEEARAEAVAEAQEEMEDPNG